jgi:hypothetical protein
MKNSYRMVNLPARNGRIGAGIAFSEMWVAGGFIRFGEALHVHTGESV